jgi:hypothetical protein
MLALSSLDDLAAKVLTGLVILKSLQQCRKCRDRHSEVIATMPKMPRDRHLNTFTVIFWSSS